MFTFIHSIIAFFPLDIFIGTTLMTGFYGIFFSFFRFFWLVIFFAYSLRKKTINVHFFIFLMMTFSSVTYFPQSNMFINVETLHRLCLCHIFFCCCCCFWYIYLKGNKKKVKLALFGFYYYYLFGVNTQDLLIFIKIITWKWNKKKNTFKYSYLFILNANYTTIT